MNALLYRLLETQSSYTQLIARVVLGVVIFPHGAQKMLGIWGGHGLQAVIDSFNQWFGIPNFITVLVALGEFVGSIFLIIGFFSRFAAASIILIMLGAIYYVVNDHFFMNWYSEQRGEGFEFHLLAIGLAIIVLLNGSGKFSIDNFLVKFLKKDSLRISQ